MPDPDVVHMMAKGDVNGAQAPPLWRFLRHSLPFPEDRDFDDEADAPNGVLAKGGLAVLWKPISRTGRYGRERERESERYE